MSIRFTDQKFVKNFKVSARFALSYLVFHLKFHLEVPRKLDLLEKLLIYVIWRHVRPISSEPILYQHEIWYTFVLYFIVFATSSHISFDLKGHFVPKRFREYLTFFYSFGVFTPLWNLGMDRISGLVSSVWPDNGFKNSYPETRYLIEYVLSYFNIWDSSILWVTLSIPMTWLA